MTREAVIVSTARTPIGKAYRGAFNDTDAPTMGGHVIAEAVSIAENRSVTQFWRDFVERARTENGYTEETYFELVQERTGDQAFADKLRDFVRTPLANPDREIGRLLAAAHMTARNAPLAPAQGR